MADGLMMTMTMTARMMVWWLWGDPGVTSTSCVGDDEDDDDDNDDDDDKEDGVVVVRRSWGYQDELCWGAAWLYKATGEAIYKSKAEQALSAGNALQSSEFSWDDKGMGCAVSVTCFFRLCKAAHYCPGIGQLIST